MQGLINVVTTIVNLNLMYMVINNSRSFSDFRKRFKQISHYSCKGASNQRLFFLTRLIFLFKSL